MWLKYVQQLLLFSVDAIDDEEYMEELAADDPDAASDPLNQVDLHDYLRSFLQELSQQPYFHLFAQHHNSMEQTVLRGIGISNVWHYPVLFSSRQYCPISE